MQKNNLLNKDLSIIIVTFESEFIIKNCLKNINFDKYDVFVVDNNSSDNTAKIVKKDFPQANLMKLDKNSGYGRANNAALKQVKTPYSLILNPDAILFEEDIQKIINLLEKNPKIAIASAMMYDCVVENNKIIESSFVKCCIGTKVSENEEAYFTRFISGAGMFLNMEIFKNIGFFDENFFLYCEDNEICKRSLKKGYKNAIVKGTKLYHQSGKSSSTRVENKVSGKIIWHKNGWSKAYYAQAVHGIIWGKLKAVRVFLKYLFLIIKDLLLKGKIDQLHKYSFLGNLAYLVGFKAFDKDRNPRG